MCYRLLLSCLSVSICSEIQTEPHKWTLVRKVTIRLRSVKLNRQTFSVRVVAFHSYRPNDVKLIRTRSSGRRHFDLANVCRGSLAFGKKLKDARGFQGKCLCLHVTVPGGVFNLRHGTRFMQTTKSANRCHCDSGPHTVTSLPHSVTSDSPSYQTAKKYDIKNVNHAVRK